MGRDAEPDGETGNTAAKDLLEAGRNCWCLKTARRAAFIIDGEAYFRAVYEAFSRARRSILIVGWDLHSEVRLLRPGSKSRYSTRLGKMLDQRAREQSGLDVYLLSWDFAMIYALEREFFPRYKLEWRTHKRIHFCLDGEHPVGASQHQKIVVVDDAVAFCGGFDLSKWRWDTSSHRAEDERRSDPDSKSYPPFHDVQMAVDGEAAATLAELARERWRRACGQTLSAVSDDGGHDPWPESVAPDAEDVAVAISRTLPNYENHEEIREVENLYLDSVDAARKVIYIENQYLSSYRIGEALKARLAEETGPEVVVVMPRRTGGWLEQHTMDVLRARILKELKNADRYDRFRIYYPLVSTDPEQELMVHAKVMIIDDWFVRVGSSNLSNRSLGLDSECDLAFAAEPGSAEARAIRLFRNTLVGEHLGVAPEEVDRAVAEEGMLGRAIDSLSDGERLLLPLGDEVEESVEQLVPDAKLLDPEKPIEPDELLDYFLPPDERRPAYAGALKVLAIVGAIVALPALWHWTPLGDWLDMERLTDAVRWLQALPYTPLLVLIVYMVGSLVAVPVTLMIIGTLIIFGPWWGAFYALLGSQLGALLLFYLGRLLGRDIVSRYAGSVVNRVNRRLSSSGFLAVVVFRLVPVAPFSVINLVAGISKIRWRDFVLGTFVGMLPAVIALAAVADRLAASVMQPDMTSITILLAVVGAAVAGLIGLRYWLRSRQRDRGEHERDT